MSIRQEFHDLSLDKQVFVIATVLSVVFGSLWAAYTHLAKPTPPATQISATSVSSSSTMKLHTTGNQSPVINSSGPVNVNFGNNPLPRQEKHTSPPPPFESPANVQQHTEGYESPAIHSKDDVNIQD